MIDVLRQRQQAGADGVGFGAVGCFEEDAVVLVGMQGLLATSFAAKAQPAEWHAGVAALGQRQLDYPAHGVVVEQGDDLGYLRG